MSLALATDGFWRTASVGSNAPTLVSPLVIEIATTSENFNELYTGETGTPLSIMMDAANAGLNATDWTFSVRIVSRDTGAVAVDSTNVTFGVSNETGTEGWPTLSYMPLTTDFTVAGRYQVQFELSLVGDSGQRYLLTVLPLNVRASL